MSTALKERTVLAFADADPRLYYPQIDAIRRKFYGDRPVLNDPQVLYTVAVRGDRVTACYGLKVEGKRALVVDFYGTNARDWKKLLHQLLWYSDEVGLELSAWVFFDNKNIKYFRKWGFKDEAWLIRRQPHKDVK